MRAQTLTKRFTAKELQKHEELTIRTKPKQELAREYGKKISELKSLDSELTSDALFELIESNKDGYR